MLPKFMSLIIIVVELIWKQSDIVWWIRNDSFWIFAWFIQKKM